MALSRLHTFYRSLRKRPNQDVICSVLQSGWIEQRVGARRYLLSEGVIRLQELQRRKVNAAHSVSGIDGSFVEELSQKLQRKELILKDELKLLLHLCQSAEDMVVARDAMFRYHAENTNMVFGEFNFGPVFMRQCYHLGLEEMAAAVVNDPKSRGFFKEATSFNIVMDMLFMKGCYTDALEVLKNMKDQDVKLNQDSYILATGCCFKLNTPESYKYCTALIEDDAMKLALPRSALCFAAVLALWQQDFEKAKSFYSRIEKTENTVCQNVKVLILLLSGATTDAISVLSATLNLESPSMVKIQFSQELLDSLQLQIDHGPDVFEVQHIISQLQQNSQVTQSTLEDMLCSTPRNRPRRWPEMQDGRPSKRRVKFPMGNMLQE
ncbi:pentatricopeptide repeat-containing protein 2, mitochondrial [Aulostomus maculatus]